MTHHIIEIASEVFVAMIFANFLREYASKRIKKTLKVKAIKVKGDEFLLPIWNMKIIYPLFHYSHVFRSTSWNNLCDELHFFPHNYFPPELLITVQSFGFFSFSPTFPAPGE